MAGRASHRRTSQRRIGRGPPHGVRAITTLCLSSESARTLFTAWSDSLLLVRQCDQAYIIATQCATCRTVYFDVNDKNTVAANNLLVTQTVNSSLSDLVHLLRVSRRLHVVFYIVY